jgi:hypothetical protein
MFWSAFIAGVAAGALMCVNELYQELWKRWAGAGQPNQ